VDKPSSPEPSKRWPFRRAWRPRRLRNVALLPTLVTLGNGLCGFLAILRIGEGLAKAGAGLALDAAHEYDRAAWFILVAMVFDALDGFVARVTKTASAFGAQLDSLCDLVTFGVAPGFLVYAISHGASKSMAQVVVAISVLYALCALIRLARFTVETSPDESSHKEFAGLPSPAAAGVIASAVLPWGAFRHYDAVNGIVETLLPTLAFVMGILMVSRFKYTHLVNRLLRGTRPFVTLVGLLLVASLAFLFREFAIFLGFFAYSISGPVLWVKGRFFRRPARSSAEAAPSSQRDESVF
jgi:CDP-diacylglycerol--serine O-phosphatidyltransferase